MQRFPSGPREGRAIATVDRILVGRPLGGAGEAVGIAGGRIVALGREPDVARLGASRARRSGSPGAWIAPGFVDAHLHLRALARRELEVDCSLGACGSIEAVLAAIRAEAERRPPGEWIRAFGVDDALLPERRRPTRAELDRAAPAHPLRLLHRTGHAAFLNRAALARTGLLERHPEGFLLEPARALAGLVPPPAGAALSEALAAVSARLAASGITTIHDPTPEQAPEAIADLAAEAAAGRIRQRLRFYAGEAALGTVLPCETEATRVRVAGVKLVAIEGDDPEALAERVAVLDRAGVSLAIHAVEGEALVAALAALAALGPARVRARRHRIEHASLVPPPLVEEIARLGATVVTHPLFAEAFAAKYREEIPAGEQPWLYPMRAWHEAGVPLALGSDAPIAPPDPLGNVAAAVARGLPALDAFRAHALGGARAAFDEERFGSLAIGAAADLVLLEGDPLGDPAGCRVALTLVGGEVAFER